VAVIEFAQCSQREFVSASPGLSRQEKFPFLISVCSTGIPVVISF
jgi:hypothetical protein